VSENLERLRKKLDREITFFHMRRAEIIVRKALKIARKDNDLFFINYFSAQKYILKKNFKEAIEFLDEAINIRTNDGCSYNDKALCLAEMGFYEDALRWFNEGIKRDKECIELYHNKGWLLNFLENYNEALLCFHKVLEFENTRPETLYSIADTYYKMGKYDLSFKYFKKALDDVRGKSRYITEDIKRRLRELILYYSPSS